MATILLFPILFLSMLEANSPFWPFSAPVWRSLLSHWWAWGKFFLLSTVLFAAVVGGALLCVVEVSFLLGFVVAFVTVAILMIYFRLLGRLAWCCSEEAQQTGREEGEASEEEPPAE
jgi:hypothetical protein